MTNFELEQKRFERKRITKNVFIYIMLGIWALMVIFPFYWMIISSIKSYAAYNAESVPKFFAASPTFENYITAFQAVPLLRYLLNTLIYSVATTAGMLIVTILAAFAFARLSFKGKQIAFTALLSLMMIPSELIIITNYVTITNWNLRNNFLGLILPSIASVFYIYLLKENFEQVSDWNYYAAKVDGTSDWKYLWKVLVPICKPTIVSIIILKIIECWNAYVWPNLITNKSTFYLISQGIQEIRENGFGRSNIPAMMAAVVIISLPIIALFIVFRKQIMSGVSKSGTKG